MSIPTRGTVPAAFLLLVALSGCGGGGSGTQEELVDDGVEGQPDDPIAADDCLIGDWMLDVADYGAQAEGYLTGLGIPITEFAMDGSGLLFFTAEGSMQVQVDLVTSGVLVAGDSLVPISVPSTYHASGTWSRPDADVDAIDIEDAVEEGGVGDDQLPIPLFDFAENPRVHIICENEGEQLRLQGADAPISSVWIRTN
jgi:hypothetical protein